MDQKKTGQFIAELRKEKELTQKALADRLGITNKAVSKWECGNSLPDNSIMVELCDILEISVNELLAGERISSTDYTKKAEENMMSLIKEREAKEAASFAIKAVLLAGGINSILYLVNWLHMMNDMSTWGPNMAVIILGIFYSLLIAVLLLVLKERI